MSILEQLIQDLKQSLELIESNPEQLDEKIMTKKQAKRRKKLRAKKRAERLAKKKAQQQAQEQPKEEPKEVEAELVDDGGDDNSNDDDLENKITGNDAIVLYNKEYAEAQPQDYSDAFKKFMELLIAIIEKYSPMWEQADGLWKQAGEDKPIPQQAYDLYKQAIEGLQNDLQSLMTNEFPKYAEDMYPQELQYLEYQMTAVNGFLEKQGQQIEALHPEEYIDTQNLLPGETQTTDVATTQTTDTTDTAKDDKRSKDKLMTYKLWNKTNNPLKDSWYAIRDSLDKLSKLPFVEFAKNIVEGFNGFIVDKVFGFLTSPLATDIVKTFMYANPFTKMLFDGTIVNFGVKEGIGNIKKALDKKSADKKAQRDKLGLPTNVKEWSTEKVKREFYGNSTLIDLVNLMYNHIDVDQEDKATLLRTTKTIKECFEDKEKEKKSRSKIIKNFAELIETVQKVCKYLEWNDKNIIDKVCAWWHKTKGNKGNTEEEKKEIEKLSNKKKELDQKLVGTIEGIISSDKNINDKDIIAKIQSMDKYKNWTDSSIQDHINNARKQESYTIRKRLQRLLERAEA